MLRFYHIVVEAAAPAATRTPTGATRTPAITGTAQLSETPTLTTTAGTRIPTSATATSEQRTPETTATARPTP